MDLVFFDVTKDDDVEDVCLLDPGPCPRVIQGSSFPTKQEVETRPTPLGLPNAFGAGLLPQGLMTGEYTLYIIHGIGKSVGGDSKPGHGFSVKVELWPWPQLHFDTEAMA